MVDRMVEKLDEPKAVVMVDKKVDKKVDEMAERRAELKADERVAQMVMN